MMKSGHFLGEQLNEYFLGFQLSHFIPNTQWIKLFLKYAFK